MENYLDLGYNFLLGIDYQLDNLDGINSRNVDEIMQSGAVTFDYTSMNVLSPNQNMQSEDFESGVQGWKIYGDGEAEFAGLTLTGGILKYQKTSFTDAVHSGYYLGPEGIYMGGAADSTKMKFTIATGILDVLGGEIKTVDGPDRVVINSADYISTYKANIRRVWINQDSINFYNATGTPVGTIYGDTGVLELLTPFGQSVVLTTTHDSATTDPIIMRTRTGAGVVTSIAYFGYDPVATETNLVMQGANNKIEAENFVVTNKMNNQTGTTYTLALSDICKLVSLTNANPISVTIPTDAAVGIPIGSQIDLMQGGVGKVTFSGAGVTINSKGGNKSIGAQWVGVTLIKTAANVWTLFGDLIV
jgi:hypothetical protein